MIIDYHRSDIENELRKLCQSERLHYELDSRFFEQRLFVELGQALAVRGDMFIFEF